MFADLLEHLSSSAFFISLTEGLAENLLTAGIIAPLLGAILLRWRRARWRKFRAYLAEKVRLNHEELELELRAAVSFLEKLSRLGPENLETVSEVQFLSHQSAIADALSHMEDIGAKFHFAMEPEMLEAWALYHAEVWNVLSDPNRLTWRNIIGVYRGAKGGYDFSGERMAMFEDVFQTPARMAAKRLREIDLGRANELRNDFLDTISD